MLPLLIQQTRVHSIFKIEYKHFSSDLMRDFEEAHMVNGVYYYIFFDFIFRNKDSFIVV